MRPWLCTGIHQRRLTSKALKYESHSPDQIRPLNGIITSKRSGLFASQSLRTTAHRQQRTLQRETDGGLTVFYSESLPFFLAQAIHFLRTMELLVSSMLSFENMLRRKLNLPTAIKGEMIAKQKTTVMQTTMKPTNSSCSNCDGMTMGMLDNVRNKLQVIGGYVLVLDVGGKLFSQRCLID